MFLRELGSIISGIRPGYMKAGNDVGWDGSLASLVQKLFGITIPSPGPKGPEFIDAQDDFMSFG
jgi:hypothetical protein